MRTTKTYRLPQFAIKNLEKIKKENVNWLSDSDIITYALSLANGVMRAWNDIYEEKGSDITEKFDIEDDAQFTEIIRLLYNELGHKDH